MPPPTVAAIEDARVAGQERAHGPRQRGRPRAEQEVEVIWQERLGVEGEVLRPSHLPESSDEVVAVPVMAENSPAFDPSHHDVVEGVRGIQARAARHSGVTLAKRYERSNV